MEQSERYTYWKKPWHKWVVLGGAILEMTALWGKFDDYRAMSKVEIRSELFSPSQWEIYAAQQHFQFALSSIIIAILLASFLIGFLFTVKKQRTLLWEYS